MNTQTPLVSPMANILKLSAWDFVAKTAYFFTFIFLARTLGVSSYGILEFALSLMMYFFLLADGGIELWATRESAKTEEISPLVKKVLPLRLLLAGLAFILLLGLLNILPDFPFLIRLVVLFGLSLFVQAANLKWVFLGKEHMSFVGRGLALSQLVFAIGVVVLVRNPGEVYWVPLMKLFGDLSMAGYFARRFVQIYGKLPTLSHRHIQFGILGPALVMGGTQALGILSYNFDTLIIGYMLGPMGVGVYNAAYRPVTVGLSVPLTYFMGLFPVLSRLHTVDINEFKHTVKRSFGLAFAVALPIGITGFFLSESIILFLFGEAYRGATPVLQILTWSAFLVILRGPYRQGLTAAGKQNVDFRCAAISTLTNIGFNFFLIPRFGIVGAAIATVIGDLIWFVIACGAFHRLMINASVHTLLLKPTLAGLTMTGTFLFSTSFHWVIQACLAVGTYLVTLYVFETFGNNKNGGVKYLTPHQRA